MRKTVQVDHVLGTLIPQVGQEPFVALTPLAGTGTVVRRQGDTTWVLTAGHVCEPKAEGPFRGPDGKISSYPVLTENFYIWTIELKRMDAEMIYIDRQADLCILRVAGVAGETAEVTWRDPPVGATVTHVGSPLGVLGWHRAYVQDGTYLGAVRPSDMPKDVHRELLAIPATHGSSGGGVFYRGKLWSILIMSSTGFPQFSFSTGDGPLRYAVQKAFEDWVP